MGQALGRRECREGLQRNDCADRRLPGQRLTWTTLSYPARSHRAGQFFDRESSERTRALSPQPVWSLARATSSISLAAAWVGCATFLLLCFYITIGVVGRR